MLWVAGAIADGDARLWWCYFQRAERLGARAAETAEDAGAVALWGTWTLTLIVLGLIAIAVADALAIAHPGDDATVGFRILAFGGPALFLFAQLLFHRGRSDMPHDHARSASSRSPPSRSPPPRSR